MGKPGTIKTFNNARGFGYITPDDGTPDVFFHLQAISNGNESNCIPGTKLMFEEGVNNANGMTKAVQVLLQGAPEPATPLEVQQFLIMNPVEEKAQQKFMAMDPMMQRMVLSRGSLEGSRDPTAAFIGRMVAIERAARAAPVAVQDLQGMKAGTVKSFINDKGFGYIQPADFSEDVFFHLQAVTNGGEMDMIPGAALKYEEGINPANGKTKATRVQLDVPGAFGNQYQGGKGYGKAAAGMQAHGSSPYGALGADPFGGMMNMAGMAGMDAMAGMAGNWAALFGAPQMQMQAAALSGVEPATPQEVQEFLIMNPVEPHAQQKFMQMDPTMQRRSSTEALWRVHVIPLQPSLAGWSA